MCIYHYIKDIYRLLCIGPAVLSLLVACSTAEETYHVSHISVQRADGTWTLVDNAGREISNANFDIPATAMSNDIFILGADEGSALQMLNSDLKKRGDNPPIAAGHMAEGCIPVVMPGGRLQVLNPSGKVKFEMTEIEGSPVMAAAHGYSDGLLLVATAACKTYYVDDEGNVVTNRVPTPVRYQSGKIIRNGNLYGVVDTEGAQLLPVKYSYIQSSPAGWLYTLPNHKGAGVATIKDGNLQLQDLDYEQIYYVDTYGYIGYKQGRVYILDNDFKPASDKSYRQVSAAKQSGILQSRHIDAEQVANSAYQQLHGELFADVKDHIGQSPAQIPAITEKEARRYSRHNRTVSRDVNNIRSDNYRISAALYFNQPVSRKNIPDDDEDDDSPVTSSGPTIFNPDSRMYAYGLRIDFKNDNASAVAKALAELVAEKNDSRVDGNDRVYTIKVANRLYVIETPSTRTVRILILNADDRTHLQQIEQRNTGKLKRRIPYARPPRR